MDLRRETIVIHQSCARVESEVENNTAKGVERVNEEEL